ncbi:MAG: hypothetical protein R3D44_12150 [Hyphomicrobiaceae bacterium]
MRDMTQAIMTGTRLPQDLENLKAKARTYPMVKDLAVDIAAIRGEPVGPESYRLELSGAIAVATKLLLRPRFDVVGEGVLDAGTRRLRVSSVRVTNDPTGLLNKLAGWVGLGVGQEVGINDEAIGVIRSELGA